MPPSLASKFSADGAPLPGKPSRTTAFIRLPSPAGSSRLSALLAANRPDEAKALAGQFGFLNYDGPRLKPNRERKELEDKLQSLNFKIPWLDD